MRLIMIDLEQPLKKRIDRGGLDLLVLSAVGM